MDRHHYIQFIRPASGSQKNRLRDSSRLCVLAVSAAYKGGEESEAVTLEAPVESAAAEPKCLCGLADIPVVPREGLFYKEALHLLEAHFFQPRRPLAARPQSHLRGLHHASLGHEDRPLDHVIELPYISGPGMVEKDPGCGIIETRNLFAVTLRVLSKKMLGQKRDVGSPVSQRRLTNFDRV